MRDYTMISPILHDKPGFKQSDKGESGSVNYCYTSMALSTMVCPASLHVNRKSSDTSIRQRPSVEPINREKNSKTSGMESFRENKEFQAKQPTLCQHLG